MQNTKAQTNAPCGYLTTVDGESKTGYPDIACSRKCESCGWNPKEQARRLASGRWGEIGVRLNIESGEIVKVPEGTRKLFFKGVENGTEI